MQVVRSVAELDAMIAECDRAEAISDEAMRAVLGSFRMEVPQTLPSDPFDPAYRTAQLDLYTHITGLPYSTVQEATKFDIEAAVRAPFPFYTGSSATAGEYFMAIGFVLQTMALPPGSRVLEFGPGWGHTSLWLAQLGHHVTVVDVENCFCELITRRAAAAGVSVAVINGDFFHAERETRQFDAVLFYDCFHHCDDHLRLLRALKRIVAPSGRVFFGAEPIVADFPVPWGIRLDGWALWGVRKNGWMELGFRDDYFAGALAHTGWFGRRIAISGADRLRVWEACHRETAAFRFEASDNRLQTGIGVKQGGAIVLDGARRGTGVYGPYIDLPPGVYLARLFVRSPSHGSAVMDIAHGGGQHRLVQKRLGQDLIEELRFESRSYMEGVEVRLFCDPGFKAIIERVEILPTSS